MEYYKVILEPKSSFQLNSFGSSMISRVIISNLVTLFGDNIISEIRKHDTFAVSDLLPWSECKSNKNKIFFLPFPKIKLPFLDSIDSTRIKELKKVKYISTSAFNNFFDDLKNNLNDLSRYEIRNNLIFEKELIVLYEQEERIEPHNVPLRDSGFAKKENGDKNRISKQFYHTKAVWIRNGGLYFYIYTPENLKDKIFSALYLLEDKGLGKKLSSGSGRFNVKIVPNEQNGILEDPIKEATSMLLSQWIPTDDEINNIDLSSYDLYRFQPIDSKGGMSDTLKSIEYVTAGSQIKNNDSAIIGNIHDIGTENHPSLAWGKAIVIKGVAIND